MPGSSGPCWPMMRRIDNPPRARQRCNGLREKRRAASHRRITPRSAARSIRDDTRGTPSAFRPWTNCRPGKAVVLMRRTRAYFIKARTHRLSIERPDIYTQPCMVVHRVLPAVVPEAGSIYKFVLKNFKIDPYPSNSPSVSNSVQACFLNHSMMRMSVNSPHWMM